ncbi:MAG: LytR C-terminal domain-containing protein [Patescibacteria group bacterium]
MFRKGKKIVEIINKDFKLHIVKTAILFCAMATSYLIWENIFLSFIIGAAIVILFLDWDSRFFIGFGLLFIIACPVWLSLDKQDVAEKMAVYAYYMLALGVIMQVVQHAKAQIFKPKRRVKNAKEKMDDDMLPPKRTWLYVSSAAAGVLLCVCGGGYFMLRHMENKLVANSTILNDAFNARLAEAQQAAQKIAGEKIISGPPISWDKVNISIINTTGQTVLGASTTDSFTQLGCKNVSQSQSTSTPFKSTLVEYCPACQNVAQELLSVLKSPTEVLFVENSELNAAIRVILGEDQLSVSTTVGSDIIIESPDEQENIN